MLGFQIALGVSLNVFFSSAGVRGLGNAFKTAPLDAFNIVYEKMWKLCFSICSSSRKLIDKSIFGSYDIYTFSECQFRKSNPADSARISAAYNGV